MVAGRAVDKLGGDAHAVACFPDASFEDVGHAECPRHLLHIDLHTRESECGVTGNDRQRGDLRQVRDDVLGYAVAEIFLLRLAAHVDERKYAHRFLLLPPRSFFRTIGGMRARVRTARSPDGLEELVERLRAALPSP